MDFWIQSIDKDDECFFSNFPRVADWTKKEVLQYLILKTSFGWGVFSKKTNEMVGLILIAHVLDAIEILTLETHVNVRRKGVGTLLLNQVFNYAKESDVQQIFLEVKETNLSAQSLYKTYGFEPYGIRKKYYTLTEGSHVDAILYRMILNDQEKKNKIRLD